METIKFIPTLDEQSFSEFYSWNELLNSFPDYDFESIQSGYDHLEAEDAFTSAQVWLVLDLGERYEFYHITDFLRWGTGWTPQKPEEFKDFDAYKYDGFASTVLLKLSEDCSMYKCSIAL